MIGGLLAVGLPRAESVAKRPAIRTASRLTMPAAIQNQRELAGDGSRKLGQPQHHLMVEAIDCSLMCAGGDVMWSRDWLQLASRGAEAKGYDSKLLSLSLLRRSAHDEHGPPFEVSEWSDYSFTTHLTN